MLSNAIILQDGAIKTSIIRPLFIFYILMLSNYTSNILGKQIKSYLNENRLFQHMIGLITMISIIHYIKPQYDNITLLTYSIITYGLFIITTKLDIQTNLILIILLFASFMIENKLDIDLRAIIDDTLFNAPERDEHIRKHTTHKTFMATIVIGFVIIGMALYAHKKTDQYGGSFDGMTFMFG